MPSAEQIANQLGNSKRSGDGYMCKCPVHDDRKASLWVADAPNNHLAIHCHAGCDEATVRQTLGLTNGHYPMQRNLEATYNYTDAEGKLLFQKVRMLGKGFFIRRPNGNEWINNLKGIDHKPLFNLSAVIKAISENRPVAILEGEKDCKNFERFSNVASTCNFDGASKDTQRPKWRSEYSQQLKGARVIVFYDNDAAGIAHKDAIVKSLTPYAKTITVYHLPETLNALPVKDFSDWLTAGGNAEHFKAVKTEVIPVGTLPAQEKKVAAKKATREEYYQLFNAVWMNPKRCMFSRKLMFWDNAEGLWNPCINGLDVVRSEALVLNETRESKFVMSSFEPHFFAFEASKECELLVDIPEWDGQERIYAMASLVKLKPGAGVDQLAWAELLMEWCALVFERLENPKVQNRILILQGGQGIGKDTWTDMLVDGLGQFCIPLNVVGNDKDTFLSLHDGLVMKISEFDKTSKTEVSTLKDMITAPKTMLRGAYERDRRVRNCRCSFISSANVEDLLRDHTGSRRYMIVEIDRIEYGYKGWTEEQVKTWQMQCLAEMRKLANEHYRASEASHRQMREYLESKTPSDPCADVIELFCMRLRRDNTSLSYGEIRIAPNDERAVTAIGTISKDTGMKQRTIRNMLNSKLIVRARIGDQRARVWVIPPVSKDGPESVDLGNPGEEQQPLW